MQHSKVIRPAAALRPALMARYQDLGDLRHDYPLVLVEQGGEGALIRPLSRILDEALRASAPVGAEGEALRQQALRLETELRRRVLAGAAGRLSDLWRAVEADLVRQSGEAPFGPLDRNLDLVRKHIAVDGAVIGCDAATLRRVLEHVWRATHDTKAHAFRKTVEGLILRLSDILKSDHMKSDEAHGSEALASAMATRDGSVDFAALSDVLHRQRPEDRLPAARVARIETALRALQCQPFFGPGRASQHCADRRAPYTYVFDSCSAALEAHRERLPDVLEFTKALTIAELEVENKYRPELHDAVFASFDESDLSADQLDLLPSTLICLRDGVTASAEISRAYEALACGLPFKVLVQVDDILGPTAPEPPRNSFGAGTARLASMAMGLNNAFALQSTSAHLYRLRDTLSHGMTYRGPALFSLYSGATATMPGIPPYILAAAASEARAFPNFAYDPGAGADWAGRFDLGANPQLEGDWPEYPLAFEDALGQRNSETVAFTFVDFAICDARYARFCHPAAPDDRTQVIEPAAAWLNRARGTRGTDRPYVLAVDPDNRLMRIVVDDRIAVAALGCKDAWNRLQELAGINNSHANRLLAEERRAREAVAQAVAQAAVAPVAVVPAAPAPQAVSEPQAADDGAPWIETPRCTTCNECKQISSGLFDYDENMQAFIKNPDGGTYRQLVEAAESCQVSIIHPGRPRDPNEPNLAELIERAKPFN